MKLTRILARLETERLERQYLPRALRRKRSDPFSDLVVVRRRRHERPAPPEIEYSKPPAGAGKGD